MYGTWSSSVACPRVPVLISPATMPPLRTRGGRAYLEARGQEAFELRPRGEATYDADAVDATVEFGVGEADSLVLRQGGEELRARRVS